MMYRFICMVFFLPIVILAQNGKEPELTGGTAVSIQEDTLKTSPLKAAMYSALLPGLGQFYNAKNKPTPGVLKYWKVPVALGGVVTGFFVIDFYNDRYLRLRDAYIAELNGETHEFSNVPGYTEAVLANAQDRERRNRDYAIVFTVLFYGLQIIDATVDAHLAEFDRDKDLALHPVLLNDPISFQPKIGLGLNFTF